MLLFDIYTYYLCDLFPWILICFVLTWYRNHGIRDTFSLAISVKKTHEAAKVLHSAWRFKCLKSDITFEDLCLWTHSLSVCAAREFNCHSPREKHNTLLIMYILMYLNSSTVDLMTVMFTEEQLGWKVSCICWRQSRSYLRGLGVC